jgi:hypothetical protein
VILQLTLLQDANTFFDRFLDSIELCGDRRVQFSREMAADLTAAKIDDLQLVGQLMAKTSKVGVGRFSRILPLRHILYR